ncbi:MAG: T9SS type A sorting domain-containing protein [Chitinophagales bacterium]|nr:T9SS type A sorting domain-containing protein [Chitinophagaceae bacterium]MCB9066070.1 T9SS type A sorting domain-containing protein [Chitinophagales bacterium]
MRFRLIIMMLGMSLSAVAQYPPQAGVSGSTAISANDSRFVAWANTCTLVRGWVDIADKSQGYTGFGAEADATGKKDGRILCMGDSGVATLTFVAPLFNGPGADFAVFENGFANPNDPEEAFLELAFVEVSSDGVNFVRFPASCLIDTPQIPGAGVYSNARKINNMAGKYIAGYGTPFDLEELKGIPELDVNNVTHIRIVDAIGSLGVNASLDKDGNKVNDPYPTPFITGGFDLDAVGGIHVKGQFPSSVGDVAQEQTITVAPNPAREHITVSLNENVAQAVVTLTDAAGRLVKQYDINHRILSINIGTLQSGVYFLTSRDEQGNKCTARFVKY